jgi:hypothetical protein
LRNSIRQSCTKTTSRILEDLKSKYFDDSIFFTDLVSQLSQDLQVSRQGTVYLYHRRSLTHLVTLTGFQQNSYLKHGLNQVNGFLTYRAALTNRFFKQQFSDPGTLSETSTTDATDLEVPDQSAKMNPSVLLHYPLLYSGDRMLRVLRVASDECALLPSKERCPYLLVVEVVEEDNAWGRDAGVFDEKAIRNILKRSSYGDADTLSKSGDASDIASASNSEVDRCDIELSDGSDVDMDDGNNITDMDECGVVGSEDECSRKSVESVAAATVPDGMQPQSSQQQPDAPLRFKRRLNRLQHHSFLSRVANVNRVSERSSRGSSGIGGRDGAVTSVSFQRPPSWKDRVNTIKQSSPYSHMPGWGVRAFIVKGGAPDIRREELAMQVIDYMQNIFQQEGVGISLHPYRILATAPSAGLVEYLPDTISVDAIKKGRRSGGEIADRRRVRPSNAACLREFFESTYGPPYSLPYAEALQNFVRSLAGYSLVTYLLQVKDRHNGNILIDKAGHVIHIDFGFILGESPAFNINFEAAPFKLTSEYVDLMGGVNSQSYTLFQELFVQGFQAIQKQKRPILAIVESFFGPEEVEEVIGDLTKRCDKIILYCMHAHRPFLTPLAILYLRFEISRSPAAIRKLIEESEDNWHTSKYDWIQQQTNNILM